MYRQSLPRHNRLSPGRPSRSRLGEDVEPQSPKDRGVAMLVDSFHGLRECVHCPNLMVCVVGYFENSSWNLRILILDKANDGSKVIKA